MADMRRKQRSASVPMDGAAPAAASAEPPSLTKIAVRAYEIWQESGRPDGKHEEHWYRAEQELRGKLSNST